MDTLKKINPSILWTAFRNLLVVIGGIAIAAYISNLHPWAIVVSVLWLLLILAVLYGIELGRRHEWKERWDEKPEAFGPRARENS